MVGVCWLCLQNRADVVLSSTLKQQLHLLWLPRSRMSCSWSFSMSRAFGGELALGQARRAWGFLLAHRLVCIWNRWTLMKIRYILAFVVETEEFFISTTCICSFYLYEQARSSPQPWWQLSTRRQLSTCGSACLAGEGACWLVSEVLRAGTAGSRFHSDGRNWMCVYQRLLRTAFKWFERRDFHFFL